MNLKTRIRSRVMRHFAAPEYLEKSRAKARKQRKKNRQAPTVRYFHQVDDPYSHLAVQKLDQLRQRYDLPFVTHLVSPPDAAYQGSTTHFAQWAVQDAAHIATDYGTEFAPAMPTPNAQAIGHANQTLAGHLNQADFAQVALQLGRDLWAGNEPAQQRTRSMGEDALVQGTQLRRELGHYQGAMFYFDGEWFWGVDRLRLLEQRLCAEGFDLIGGAPCVPEPTPMDVARPQPDIVVEYFPSLRSPYTAVGHRRVLDLIAATGVSVTVRPVMPMLMRGIPAPRAKQRYIITDAAREGRVHGSPLGQIVDPFGEPVKRAFALFPGAAQQGRDMAFITAYLQAAWFDGVDITNHQGLRQVAAQAGLEWHSLQQQSQDHAWEAVLADNLEAMSAHHLWGVPSFRVTGGNARDSYACWGQDRIWRIANEIARRAQ